jgi:hypothetical protein
LRRIHAYDELQNLLQPKSGKLDGYVFFFYSKIELLKKKLRSSKYLYCTKYQNRAVTKWNRNKVVGITTRLRIGQSGVQIPLGARDFYPKPEDQLLGPTQPPFEGPGIFYGGGGAARERS